MGKQPPPRKNADPGEAARWRLGLSVYLMATCQLPLGLMRCTRAAVSGPELMPHPFPADCRGHGWLGARVTGQSCPHSQQGPEGVRPWQERCPWLWRSTTPSRNPLIDWTICRLGSKPPVLLTVGHKPHSMLRDTAPTNQQDPSPGVDKIAPRYYCLSSLDWGTKGQVRGVGVGQCSPWAPCCSTAQPPTGEDRAPGRMTQISLK